MKLSIIVGFVCCCFISLISPAFAQTLTFTNLTYSRGTYRQTPTVALADVNGDGRTDLICANYFASTLSVLTNNGSGRFYTNATISVGTYPSIIVAADVNGDGKTDLINLNGGPNTLTVKTNNGVGVFGLKSTVSLPSGSFWLASADVNGDGKVDLITANFSSTIMIFTNDGSGGFTTNATLVVPNIPFSSFPQPVLAADANGDGKPDILCLDQNNHVLIIYTNSGGGTFGSFTNLSLSGAPSAFAAADVNGDGTVDLMIADYGAFDLGPQKLAVWTNNGAGIFTSNNVYTIGHGAEDVQVTDINGDGKPDIIVASDGTCPGNGPPCDAGTLTILTNNGSGTFGTGATLAAGFWTGQLAIGDVNGDGKIDVVCSNVGYTNYAPCIVMEFFNTSFFSAPNLKPARSGNNVVMTWPSYAGNFALQTNSDLSATNWVSYGGVISDNGINKSVTNTPSAAKLFFRLKQ